MVALDPTFDEAIMAAVKAFLPRGFYAQPEAPSTLDGIIGHYRATGRVRVWDGASDHTIFGSPRVNHAFRAWHDLCHIAGNFPFTLEGEKAAAEMQKGHLKWLFPDHPSLERWCRLIDIEVVGQAEHFEATGQFPEDQRAFALERL